MNSNAKVKQLARLTGHSGSVYSLCIGFKPNHFISGGSDRVVAEWDLANPLEGKMIAGSNEVVYSLFNDEKMQRLFIGQAAGGIHVINFNDNKEERLLQYHSTSVFHINCSLKHNLLFSLSGDGDVAVIDRSSLALIKKLHLLDGKLRTAAMNTAETEIAIGAADGCIYLFSLPEMSPIKKWQAHTEAFSVNAIAYSHDGKHLLSGSRDAHLNIFDIHNDHNLFKSIPAHNYAIYAIAYSPDRSLIATASRDKTVKLWDAENFNVLQRLDKESMNGHANSVNHLLWMNDKLITTGDDRSIIIWEVEQ
jgi:WD repeat-containing protein 61